ncbi:MAG: hypothetical protein ACHWZW_02870 [Spirulina sp.]
MMLWIFFNDACEVIEYRSDPDLPWPESAAHCIEVMTNSLGDVRVVEPFFKQYLQKFYGKPEGSAWIDVYLIRWRTQGHRITVEAFGRCGGLLYRRESDSSYAIAAFSAALNALAEQSAIDHESIEPPF